MTNGKHAPGRCISLCGGEYPDQCALSSDVDHTLHICGDPGCDCHAASRYAAEAEKQRRRRLMYAEIARQEAA